MTRTLQVLILLRTDPASRPVLCYTEPAPVRSVPIQNSSVEICFSTELSRCDQSCTEPAGKNETGGAPAIVLAPGYTTGETSEASFYLNMAPRPPRRGVTLIAVVS